MDTLFLGKMIAPYLFVSGLGFLLSYDFYKQLLINSDKSDPLTINLSGMVHFFIGLAIVLRHHLWGNVLEIINDNWDQMIDRPPCAELANS